MGGMPESTAARPTQVTIAAWLVMASSVFVVLTAFDQIAGLHTMETRESVEEFLSKPPGDALGLGLQGALSAMRVLTMIAAACATAAAILGFQVLRRSRSARLVLTVLAAPIFLTGVVVGGFLPAVITGSIVMMWVQPARDWIDGKTPRVAVAPPAPVAPRQQGSPPPPPVAPPPPPSEARPFAGFGEAPAYAAQQTQQPPHLAPPGWSGPPRPPERPAALTWACALTWAGCAVVITSMLASIVLVLAAPEMLFDELYRQNPDLEADGLDRDTLRSTVLFAGTLVIAWSAVASVLAAFAWRGRPWALSSLLVSASCAAVLCLLAVFGGPLMIVPLLLVAGTIPMLLRPEVRAYVQRRAADSR